MAVPPHDSSQHRRPHTPPMAAPFLEFDLTRELAQLHAEPDWSNGQNAKTLVKYNSLRVVLMALKARARLPEHQTKGRISIHTIAGHILAHAQGRTFDLPAGSLLALDQGLPHDVEALEDSAFLLSGVRRERWSSRCGVGLNRAKDVDRIIPVIKARLAVDLEQLQDEGVDLRSLRAPR